MQLFNVNINNRYHEQHPFHLVQNSVRPFFVSWGLFFCVLCLLNKMHPVAVSSPVNFLFLHFPYWPLALLAWHVGAWFKDISNESSKEKAHTKLVQHGLASGMVLFIASEVMFFFAFFWAIFHFSVSPAITVGAVWPSAGLQTIDPYGVPLINTLLLLSSGITLTWAHRYLLALNNDPVLNLNKTTLCKPANPHAVSKWHHTQFYSYITALLPAITANVRHTPQIRTMLYNTSSRHQYLKTAPLVFSFSNSRAKLPAITPSYMLIIMLAATISLGLIFLGCQAYEYLHAPYTLLDGAYASIFFLATGFHGFHVLCGTVFLVICLILAIKNYYSATRHISFEMAAWYWHFVDVVWVLLYICLYCLSPLL